MSKSAASSDGTGVRESLRSEFLAVVIGPQRPDETLNSNPSDTYLTGMLWPRGSTLSGEEDDAASAERAGDEAAAMDQGVPGYRAIRPCSLGLTFAVRNDVVITVDLANTARYIPVEKPSDDKADSEPAAVAGTSGDAELLADGAVPAANEADNLPEVRKKFEWVRVPLNYRLEIKQTETRAAWRTSDFVDAKGMPVTDSRIALDIKRRAEPEKAVFTLTLINIAAESQEQRDKDFLFQAGIHVRAVGPEDSPAILQRPKVQRADDEDALTNLLLYRDVREYAVGHGIAVQWSGLKSDCVESLETSWVPFATVKGMDPKGHNSLSEIQKRAPSLFSAAWLAREPARAEVCNALDEYCHLYGTWIKNELEGNIGQFSGDLRTAAEANLKRCGDTLIRMRRGVGILRKDDDAWIAFVFANAAMDIQSRYPSKGDKAGPLVWRPFQLAFVLMVIPTIVDPKDEDRDTMDLLWFPTGGGKTEAYLALTAFSVFIGRLRSAQRRSTGGVDVLMRYTLRLLTVQQFQRAAALITACDGIRAKNPGRFGDARISIGLYVGGDSTPNLLEEAEERLDEERNGGKPRSTPRQLLACPVCGAGLASKDYVLKRAELSMEIVCPASACITAGTSLPIMTVDEAIYAHPTSLVIGTVDKFAQLPRRTDIRKLFGLDGADRPGLIIQDELHLISGPLGSMAGLYEAAIDMLCTRDGIRPKLIGSTATIGRAATQVRALFDRDVLQFPPPGFDAKDSFFAVRDDVGADRIYMGVATAGRSPKFTLQAVLAALLQSASTLVQTGRADESSIDPYWTCVAYFNSLRELGGAHVLMLDDVPRQMGFLAKKGGLKKPRLLEGPPDELSSRVSSNRIPEVLQQLGRKLGDPDPYAPSPSYAVLASNMISVGVDVPRLGLMVVNGQPKSTAEYIQATSRVGRGIPGLVVTVYNFGRPRDVSHYEHFLGYHGALYRSVEATSVTPWAPRARDKALHAVLIASVRHLVAGLVDDEAALKFDPAAPEVKRIVDRLLARASAGSSGLETIATRADLNDIVTVWKRRANQSISSSKRLRYWEKRAPFGNTAPHLMRAAEEARSAGSISWPTPNSMREVEPSTAFVLKTFRTRKASADGDA